MDISSAYDLFEPPARLSRAERCDWNPGKAIKLSAKGGIGFNPLYCLDCNKAVQPSALELPLPLALEIVDWFRSAKALNALELDSGAYEEWAREILMDITSETNQRAMHLVTELNDITPSFFEMFPGEPEDGGRRGRCPSGEHMMTRYDRGVYPQFICDEHRLVLPA